MELWNQLLGYVVFLFDLFLHLDVHLNQLVVSMGAWVYLLLFAVIFCETGLVVTPILPGDSLLFAAGALASIEGSPINVVWLGILLFIAAVLGDALNYTIGARIGPRVFQSGTSRFLNHRHLETTRVFFDRHGGKTIIIARFMPIIRTFAPFVAGIGRMGYRRFAAFNVVGAALWVGPLLAGGYMLGNVPAVKRNFHIIIVAIVFISVLPAAIEYLKARRRRSAAHSSC